MTYLLFNTYKYISGNDVSSPVPNYAIITQELWRNSRHMYKNVKENCRQVYIFLKPLHVSTLQ